MHYIRRMFHHHRDRDCKDSATNSSKLLTTKSPAFAMQIKFATKNLTYTVNCYLANSSLGNVKNFYETFSYKNLVLSLCRESHNLFIMDIWQKLKFYIVFVHFWIREYFISSEPLILYHSIVTSSNNSGMHHQTWILHPKPFAFDSWERKVFKYFQLQTIPN